METNCKSKNLVLRVDERRGGYNHFKTELQIALEPRF